MHVPSGYLSLGPGIRVRSALRCELSAEGIARFGYPSFPSCTCGPSNSILAIHPTGEEAQLLGLQRCRATTCQCAQDPPTKESHRLLCLSSHLHASSGCTTLNAHASHSHQQISDLFGGYSRQLHVAALERPRGEKEDKNKNRSIQEAATLPSSRNPRGDLMNSEPEHSQSRTNRALCAAIPLRNSKVMRSGVLQPSKDDCRAAQLTVSPMLN
jgi:hypothetical protein